MKKLLLTGLSAMAFSANAATIIQSGDIANGPVPDASFPLSSMFTFNQFDPALGTLNSVTFTIDATASARVESDNESGSAVTFTASLNGSVEGTIPSLVVTAVLTQSPESVEVTADDDDTVEPGGADFVGGDANDFGTVSDADAASDAITTGLGAYIGTGTLNGTTEDNQTWGVSGGGDAQTRVTESQSFVTWTVVYDYDPVPEPSTAIASLLGALMLLRRRR